MISALLGALSIIVVGAICFWVIDRFGTDRRLANLLKLLVVLICLSAINAAFCMIGISAPQCEPCHVLSGSGNDHKPDQPRRRPDRCKRLAARSDQIAGREREVSSEARSAVGMDRVNRNIWGGLRARADRALI